MSAGMGRNEYVFDNSADEASKQLVYLGDILDTHSIGVLARIGPAAGWSCWDIGAGAGTIAQWLADRVGTNGSVLATDLKPQHIPRRPNLQVREHDVRSDKVPGSFDLIHARLLLMHLPEREEILRQLAGALRPGGVLVVSDWDLTTPDFLIWAPNDEAADAFRSFHRAMLAVAEMAGMDGMWAKRAPQTFRATGLLDVHTVSAVDTWIGGSTGCLLHRSNSYQLEGLLLGAGMTAAELATLRDVLTDPELALWSFQVFTTTGRRAS